MKKFLGLVLLTGAILVGCSTNENNSTKEELSKNEQSTMLLEASVSFKMVSTMQKSAKRLAKTPLDQTAKDNIVAVLPQIDMMFANGLSFSSNKEASDRLEYAIKETISFKDIDNKDNTYTMYYNEQLLPNDKDDDDDEYEEEYRMTGIAVIDNLEYSITAKKELEIEDNEKEEKMSFRIDLSSNQSIVVSQEFEEEDNETEEKFIYSLLENNRTISSYAFEIEKETNKTEIKLEINNETYRVDVRIEGTDTIFDVKYSVDKTKYETISFKKVVTTNDDGTILVNYVEII